MSLVVNHNFLAANAARSLNAHYARLAKSTERLASGMRINGAADDAAGLAIRELQRAEVAALNQGIRNANDAISLIQTADGALAVIDEKLIRLTELAEQAATGTYNSTQRMMLDSEFQAMKDEIDRIAAATDFNGVKLFEGMWEFPLNPPDFTSQQMAHYSFNGTLGDDVGGHGTGGVVNPAGVSFTDPTDPDAGPPKTGQVAVQLNGAAGAASGGNNPAGSSITLPPMEWRNLAHGGTISIWVNEKDFTAADQGSSYVAFYSNYIRIFRRNGPWTDVDGNAHNGDYIEYKMGDNNVIQVEFTPATQQDKWILHTMTLDDDNFIVYQNEKEVARQASRHTLTTPPANRGPTNNAINRHWWSSTSSASRLTMAAADLRVYTRVLAPHDITGIYDYDTGKGVLVDQKLLIHFGAMNDSAEDYYYVNIPIVNTEVLGLREIFIQTQDMAQQALERINIAVASKDKIRAHLGAMQNRLENTVTNITIQSENTQEAESRISDTDIAQAMTGFVRDLIMADSANAVLAQANTMPQMALQIING